MLLLLFNCIPPTEIDVDDIAMYELQDNMIVITKESDGKEIQLLYTTSRKAYDDWLFHFKEIPTSPPIIFID